MSADRANKLPHARTASADPGAGPFTVAEVAARFGVGAATVRTWIDAGELKAVNCSRSTRSKKPRLRITAVALAEFEAGRATTPSVEQAPRRRNRQKRPADFVVYFP